MASICNLNEISFLICCSEFSLNLSNNRYLQQEPFGQVTDPFRLQCLFNL